jgi:tetratricopeptide (TPR) repeat protein
MDKAGIIKEAQKFLAKGQIDKAIAEFEKLADSGDGNVYNTLGDLYLKKGDTKRSAEFYYRAADIFREQGFYDKAKALYKKILNINPSDYRATLALGELCEEKGLVTDAIRYFLAVADVLAKEKKRDGLVEVYQKILHLSPSNLQLRVKVADIFFKEGLTEEAAKQYSILGRLYHDSGDSNKAKDYYQRALSINPSDRSANLGLVEIYKKEGDYKSTLEIFRRLLASFPDDINILSHYIESLMKTGDISTAESELKRLVELAPENVMAKKYLTNIYIQQDKKEEAWRLISPSLDQIISFERDGIVSILEELKDVEPAECTKKLIVIYKEIGNTEKAFNELVNLGDYYLSTGLTEEAINCYKEAKELRPDDPYINAKLQEMESASEEPEIIKVKTEDRNIEEILQEADIYLKFGVYEEARKRLEPLKVQYPDNPEVHIKLKQLYLEIGDKEMAVTECLALSEIYKRKGMTEEAERFIEEARSINPDDERLSMREVESSIFSPAANLTGEEAVETFERPTTAPSREDYLEAFTEAEFYEKQGLTEEALKVYKHLQSIFPEDEQITQKIESLSKIQRTEVSEIAEGEDAGKALPLSEELGSELINLNEEILGIGGNEQDVIEAPELTEDVMDIFEEFKKGLEGQVKEEDSETHYNLGIAYKEMGLINDAIKEFQLSRKDPKYYISSINMLAVCYKEKGLYKLAIETIEEGLKGLDKSQEEYLAMRYELADAYEKDGDIASAFNLYTEIYGMDSGFRDVAQKIEALKKAPPKQKKENISSESSQESSKKRNRISYI